MSFESIHNFFDFVVDILTYKVKIMRYKILNYNICHKYDVKL